MKKAITIIASLMFGAVLQAQITERERPTEWKQLVNGARFMDRFLPMPKGKTD